jgi:hypothetical protein
MLYYCPLTRGRADQDLQSNGLSEADIEEMIFGSDKKKGKATPFFSAISKPTLYISVRIQLMSSLTLHSAAAVPGRPIISVYQHIRRIRHPLRQEEGGTGSWNAEQDARLLQSVLLELCGPDISLNSGG